MLELSRLLKILSTRYVSVLFDERGHFSPAPYSSGHRENVMTLDLEMKIKNAIRKSVHTRTLRAKERMRGRHFVTENPPNPPARDKNKRPDNPRSRD